MKGRTWARGRKAAVAGTAIRICSACETAVKLSLRAQGQAACG
eukprot:CAMPEP_0171078072 /NCGR_PEP_ID=MMETSP0766_2-20121228/14428_1 /TAXON_ID=439317 /ORGANISM="Gambierdiscus australes, Strain CAWD 149" /LENGTH=42 /DNA_ID= /DNA_START= /DNA_END= /DNA_ORIENTATION=